MAAKPTVMRKGQLDEGQGGKGGAVEAERD